METLAEKAGTFVSLMMNQCVLLPPNYSYIDANVGGGDCHGIRWQLWGTDNMMRKTMAVTFSWAP